MVSFDLSMSITSKEIEAGKSKITEQFNSSYVFLQNVAKKFAKDNINDFQTWQEVHAISLSKAKDISLPTFSCNLASSIFDEYRDSVSSRSPNAMLHMLSRELVFRR